MKKFLVVLLSMLMLLCMAFFIYGCSSERNQQIRYSQGLSYEINSDQTYTVTGTDYCLDTDIIIPPTIDGKAVTRVEGFWENSKITSVVIPDSVVVISEESFKNCSSLAKVKIGRGVAVIGEDAFSNCKLLKNILVDADNVYFKTINGNLYSMDGKKLILGASVKDLISFAMPSGVEIICDNAFSDCEKLRQVEISYGVKEIGSNAFAGCVKLESVTIPNTVKTISYSAFSNCKSLTKVVVGTGVTDIYNWAFSNCTSLTSIEFKGTKQAWQSINKGVDWIENCGLLTIICSDSNFYLNVFELIFQDVYLGMTKTQFETTTFFKENKRTYSSDYLNLPKWYEPLPDGFVAPEFNEETGKLEEIRLFFYKGSSAEDQQLKNNILDKYCGLYGSYKLEKWGDKTYYNWKKGIVNIELADHLADTDIDWDVAFVLTFGF